MKGKTESGRVLFAMLLEPVPELATKSHWILVRNGKLNLLLWDALVDNSNRYLVETENISFASSVSSAILLRNKPPIRAAKALLAVGGLPYDQSVPHSCWPERELLSVTLWIIDDTFSRFLMAQFYTELANGKTTSVALRNAKLELLKTFGPKAVPYRWAACTLEGADEYVVPFEY